MAVRVGLLLLHVLHGRRGRRAAAGRSLRRRSLLAAEQEEREGGVQRAHHLHESAKHPEGAAVKNARWVARDFG